MSPRALPNGRGDLTVTGAVEPAAPLGRSSTTAFPLTAPPEAAALAFFDRNGERMRIPSVARTVFDVSGAGDTVIAVLTVALAAGAHPTQAVQLANFAAGAVVEKLGTATASPDEILALVDVDMRG